MELKKVEAKNYWHFSRLLAQMEEEISYPLGLDRFSLHHGEDYFAFFKRLGDLHYYILEENNEPIFVMGLVLRSIQGKKCWYICDVKVHPKHRAKGLSKKVFLESYQDNIKICPRGYAVIMNPSDGSVPRHLTRFQTYPILKNMNIAGQLNIFSLEKEEMLYLKPTIQTYRGEIFFLSLKGKKDLVLQSSGKTMPLLHLQHGECLEEGFIKPQEGYSHMFCTNKGDELDQELRERKNINPIASASIVEIGMKDWNWDFILTSDI